jgi:hypothetical protein
MRKLAALIITFALGTSSAFAKSNFTSAEINAKVRAAAAEKGIAVARVHAKGLGYSASGKFRRALSQNQNGQVTEWLVGKKVTQRRNTKLVDQRTARGTADLALRRERGLPGTFSGVNSSGLSRSGKSMRVNSATDRTEATFVSVKTGKIVSAIN